MCVFLLKTACFKCCLTVVTFKPDIFNIIKEIKAMNKKLDWKFADQEQSIVSLSLLQSLKRWWLNLYFLKDNFSEGPKSVMMMPIRHCWMDALSNRFLLLCETYNKH